MPRDGGTAAANRAPLTASKADSAVRDPGGGLGGPRSEGRCEEIEGRERTDLLHRSRYSISTPNSDSGKSV